MLQDRRRVPRFRRRRWVATAGASIAALVLAGCNDFTVSEQAVYTTASTQTVTGTVSSHAGDPLTGVTVNGVDATVSGVDFEANISLDGAQVFNPVLVVAHYRSGETEARRSTVAYADGTHATLLAAGDPTPGGFTSRLTPAGLTKIAPQVTATTQLDPRSFSVPATEFGGFPSFTLTQTGLPFFGTKTVTLDSPGTLRATVRLATIQYSMRLASQLGTTCSFQVFVDNLTGTGLYALTPDPQSTNGFRVTTPGSSVLSSPDVRATGCSVAPSDVVIPALNLVHAHAEHGMQIALSDPDGTQPLEAPVAAALEQALAGFHFSGTVGGAESGVALAAPLATSFQDANGIGVGTDATFTAADVVAGAPAQSGSLAFGGGTAPPAPGTTPSGATYDVAVGTSVTAINQLLATETERGFLNSTTNTDGSQPLTYNAMDATIGLGGALAVDRPVHVVGTPELAPAVTTQTPAAGTIGVADVGGYRISLKFADNDESILELVVDFDATADFAIVGDSLRLQLTPPAATAFHIDVINDPHHVPVTAPAALLSQLDASIFANFATLPGPPLPTVPHLGLHDLDAARSGDACYFFATLS